MTPEAVNYLAKAREDLSKEIGDYGTDPDDAITMQDAEAVMVSAARLLEWVEAALR
jgi:hypothetical protein